jgi:probable rRNA maturation factor
MPRVHIHNTVSGTRIPRARLSRLADIVLQSRRVRKSVNLILVNDKAIRDLNRRFRGKDIPTDVLSFSLEEDSDPLLGEIYISIPTTKRNAASDGRSFAAELLHLFCHGLLHLSGTHHPDAEARARMKRLEDRYLAQLEKGAPC